MNLHCKKLIFFYLILITDQDKVLLLVSVKKILELLDKQLQQQLIKMEKSRIPQLIYILMAQQPQLNKKEELIKQSQKFIII